MSMETASQDMNRTQNSHLRTERLAPLTERVAAEKPHLSEGLNKLKALVGADTFDRYINPIQNINRRGQTILPVAGNETRRTHIVRECVPSIKEAFGAKIVHVFGGGGFAGVDA